MWAMVFPVVLNPVIGKAAEQPFFEPERITKSLLIGGMLVLMSNVFAMGGQLREFFRSRT